MWRSREHYMARLVIFFGTLCSPCVPLIKAFFCRGVHWMHRYYPCFWWVRSRRSSAGTGQQVPLCAKHARRFRLSSHNKHLHAIRWGLLVSSSGKVSDHLALVDFVVQDELIHTTSLLPGAANFAVQDLDICGPLHAVNHCELPQ